MCFLGGLENTAAQTADDDGRYFFTLTTTSTGRNSFLKIMHLLASTFLCGNLPFLLLLLHESTVERHFSFNFYSHLHKYKSKTLNKS